MALLMVWEARQDTIAVRARSFIVVRVECANIVYENLN